MGDQNWVYFSRHKACGHGKFSIVANLVTKNFWSPKPLTIIANRVAIAKTSIATQLAMECFGLPK